jgi:hypothetical protein
MEQMFTERLEPPAKNRAQAERLAAGLLDLCLPLPVERCAVTWVDTTPRGAPPTLLAFAIPHEVLNRDLAAQQTDGIDAERVVPAALALWTRFVRTCTPPGETIQLLLHATARNWTLLIGRGTALQSCLTLPVGDAPAIGRNLQVFAHRWNLTASQLRLCGATADEALLGSLRKLPTLAQTEILLAPRAGTFLASALAEEAVAAAGRSAGNLRSGAQTHPAPLRREARCQGLYATALVVSSLVLLTANLVQIAHGKRLADDADAALAQAADRLAGWTLPSRGAAAVELARRELETRLNPEVEAFGEVQMVSALPRLLSAAALRNISFSALSVDDRRIEVDGDAASDADVAVLREAARREALTPILETELTPGGRVHFSGTLMRKGVLP